MNLFLGVDAGQSSTRAVIGDDAGVLLARGTGGPVDHVGASGGARVVSEALTSAVDAACGHAGLERSSVTFEAAFFGFTGGGEDKRDLAQSIVAARRLGCSDDALVALAGALAGQPGIVTVAGTGSISLGRNRDGRTARAGGWGYLFGDEGSAFDLIRRAMRAALRFEEGWGPATVLHARLREAVGLDDIRLVQRRFYRADVTRKWIAGLAPIVDDAAEAGDPVAGEIIHEAADALARITMAVRDRLFDQRERVSVAPAGGAFRSHRLRAAFIARAERATPFEVMAPRYDPAIGALIEAYRLVDKRVDRIVTQKPTEPGDE